MVSGQVVPEGGSVAGVSAPAPKRGHQQRPQDARGIIRTSSPSAFNSSRLKRHGIREPAPIDHGVDGVNVHQAVWWGVRVHWG